MIARFVLRLLFLASAITTARAISDATDDTRSNPIDIQHAEVYTR